MRRGRLPAGARAIPAAPASARTERSADRRPTCRGAAPVTDPSLAATSEVAAILDVSLTHGLSSPEAASRLSAHGPNELIRERPVPVWRAILAQLRGALISLLLVAAAISFVVWVVDGDASLPFDTIVIVLIVLANAALGAAQETRARHAVEALRDLTAATAAVLRDGAVVRIPAGEVVLGDVLVLQEGDAVAADARVCAAAGLTVAESSLTGESEPVLKSTATMTGPATVGERVNMVFSGTAVTRGTGRAIVTATGQATEMGEIAGLLAATPHDPTPLQRETARIGRTLGLAVLVVAVVVMVTVLLTSELRSAEDAVTVLLLGVSLAVAAVPEGLPAVLSVVLAIGVQRMARHHAIVKDLSSVETLGSSSVICADKTGTLTAGEMTVVRVVTASGEATVTGTGYRPDGRVEADGQDLRDSESDLRTEVALVLQGGSLTNDATLRNVDGAWTVEGDPTEAAFLVAEQKLGTRDARAARFSRVGSVPFSSDRRLMTTLQSDASHSGRVRVVTKGAPDILLERCTELQVGSHTVPLDEVRRARVLADVDRLSGEALRTLAVAYRSLDVADAPDVDESIESGLVLVGMVGIIDPPRPEAARAISDARRAGIRVLMITGDHPRTAQRIAEDLGLTGPGARVLTGLDLDALDDRGREAAVRGTTVYARVAPRHKLQIVDALQAGGDVVAMTGDGVNDAPALRSADIGVAMGVTGTEVAKQAAAMILTDDNIATIVQAVREGRGIVDNIRTFLRYLLSSNMGEVLTVFVGVVGAGVLGLRGAAPETSVVVPLLATQILWINLLTDAAPAVALGVDPVMEDVMARTPRRSTDRIIDARMWAGVLATGGVMAVVTLATIDLSLPGGLIPGTGSLTTARTCGFTVLVLAQLVNCFTARSERTSAFSHLLVNPLLWGAVGLSLLLQVLVVYVPALNTAFGTSPLSLQQWLVCVGMASVVLWMSELRKVVARARQSPRAAADRP
ncbi:MAG TPA: cation-translocating P-type ATPase [Cellulomonadaceae bacterium]|nr:cation-translocating P-type ATPase [Cellulomonadaceae bacterium]